ncbi:glutamine-hydrolyzing GMP synthase [Campylobacter lari]|uniref:GMP synthase [glutamine-hydrolyzing] n=1 Tax=Campylobacter lari TaxID=201 RepID=A0A698FVY2_CAMLA|nr:glutamine-hydrolyzing GMP synthase [Campylobacter lari]ECW8955112.1 glutamine-hydrolyzing GMP synthase [Campylobacter lari]MBT0794866.1 glutamine-hydrolyzing GMP synthase [Campylobacter lari]MCR6511288.1 glutamine-hydrolyzing GMP synthase [Campylobacter lari]MCR6528052.1 glutamine-hydrolyzing GMP synthase [Campylobacter lari]MCR6557641.1 glutamine-hydrolyzing GMP synthase [Campylobacter lari]
MKKADILVLDFGSQYTQLIARRLREQGVYAEILPFNVSLDEIKAKEPKGIILSGGPASVYANDAYFCDKGVFDLNIPVLGICYGMQLMAHHFGANVAPAGHKEYGKATIDIQNDSDLFKNLPKKQTVWMSHSDKVENLPQGFEVLATSENSPFCVFGDEKRKFFALQFHPEVQHSEFGKSILKNFAKYACNCDSVWNMGSFAKTQAQKIKEEVGNDKVLCAVSGGVDSSVVAALLASAIKDQVVVVFVDNGLLRSGEKEQVEYMFRHTLGIDLISIDARENFLSRLAGVRDPEQKRKIIGNTFIEVFEEEAKKHKDVKYLAQGTLYTDIIESSVVGASKTIKSHHNVGGLPEKMNLKLIEPLKEIFKDEVRALGVELGLSKDVVYRHPFPGPGLAIRIMGEVNEPSLELLRKADVILIEELKSSGWYDKTWQAFCVLLNVQSVGVMGDNRTYDNAVCVRVVNASDGMTATFSHLPYELLENISRRIINEVEGINRVVYDISSKPPATIEWE